MSLNFVAAVNRYTAPTTIEAEEEQYQQGLKASLAHVDHELDRVLALSLKEEADRIAALNPQADSSGEDEDEVDSSEDGSSMDEVDSSEDDSSGEDEDEDDSSEDEEDEKALQKGIAASWRMHKVDKVPSDRPAKKIHWGTKEPCKQDTGLKSTETVMAEQKEAMKRRQDEGKPHVLEAEKEAQQTMKTWIETHGKYMDQSSQAYRDAKSRVHHQGQEKVKAKKKEYAPISSDAVKNWAFWHGLTLKNVTGDGCCFWYAVIAACISAGIDIGFTRREKALALKAIATGNFKGLWHEVVPALKKRAIELGKDQLKAKLKEYGFDPKLAPERYAEMYESEKRNIERNMSPHEWADDQMASTLAKLLRVTITNLTVSDTGSVRHTHSHNEDESGERAVIYIAFLPAGGGNGEANHYMYCPAIRPESN